MAYDASWWKRAPGASWAQQAKVSYRSHVDELTRQLQTSAICAKFHKDMARTLMFQLELCRGELEEAKNSLRQYSQPKVVDGSCQTDMEDAAKIERDKAGTHAGESGASSRAASTASSPPSPESSPYEGEAEGSSAGSHLSSGLSSSVSSLNAHMPMHMCPGRQSPLDGVRREETGAELKSLEQEDDKTAEPCHISRSLRAAVA
ncbi:unnamed protein product [Symbiodinium sp. CCMP2456]|nr:unnamed protein product [Symbiodinium sp. CCMP2456]